MKKRVEKQGNNTQRLTKVQNEVLFLLTKEFLTVNQIALRRGTSNKAVYKVLDILKKKGIINRAYSLVERNIPTLQPFNHSIRLHAQEFNIKILWKNTRYRELLKKSNLLDIDGNTIRLYKNSIEVYSNKSFYSEDINKATSKSIQYFNKLFVRLEHELKIIILKPRFQNIKMVNAHYSEVNNELAKDYELKGEKIKVYTTEEAKLWFTIDNSFNLHEAETLHPQSSKQDIEKVKDVFNDIRDNEHLKLSELSECIATTSKQINEITLAIHSNSLTIKGVLDILRVLLPKKEALKDKARIKPKYIG